MNKFWNIYKNNNVGEIKLYGEIVSEQPWIEEDCTPYRDFMKELQEISDCKEINVHISSGGGDVFAANAIYSSLKQLKNKGIIINAMIEGICASAATIVVMAANKITAEKNALIMIHNPTTQLYGHYDEEKLTKQKNTLEIVKKSIILAYMSKIDKTEEELSELMNNETWFTGEEALEFGFVDEIVDENVDTIKFINDNFLVFNNFVCNINDFQKFPKNKVKFNNLKKEAEELPKEN